MRIAVAGFHIECCTFSPLISQKEDFVIYKGGELLSQYKFLEKFPDCDFVPILRSIAIPGGPVERTFYDDMKREILNRLKKESPLDGIFLHMHGAAFVEGMEDVEGDFIEEIRQVVGKNCLISASYDLHGNLSQRVVDNLDILSAYRTAPHIDWYETLERSCSILVNCLKTAITPQMSFIRIPILLPGEQTSTEWEPGSSLYELIPEVIKEYNLIDASILVGYIWADEPRASASVITVGTDKESMNRGALYLAKRFWEARKRFKFGTYAGSFDDCIEIAVKSQDYPIVVSDSGDNPTAGGVGDVTFVLSRMIALNISDAIYASIMDEDAVKLCEKAGIGNEVFVSLGGKKDFINGSPLNVTGKVLNIKEDSAKNKSAKNTIVVLEVQGVIVIITEQRTPFHHIADFERLGVIPSDHKFIVVKIGYLVPELKKLATQSLLALTPGAVNQNIKAMTFSRIKRPIFPFDSEMDWHFPELDE